MYFQLFTMSYVWKLSSSICHPCDTPYNYTVKLEIFVEDYQYIMKKVLGLWNEDFTAKHKQVGITVGMYWALYFIWIDLQRAYFSEKAASNLDYGKVLAGLDPSKLNELMTAYQSELDMFGYQLNLETLQFQILD